MPVAIIYERYADDARPAKRPRIEADDISDLMLEGRSKPAGRPERQSTEHPPHTHTHT